MPDKVKRAEFVVTADTVQGVERAVRFATAHILENEFVGQRHFEKFNASIKWSVVDVPIAYEPESIIESDPVPEPPPPPAPDIPNIALMDIEDAKGVIGTAANSEELDVMLMIETSGERTPGGRKGVLAYIDKVRKGLKTRDAKEANA